MAEARIARLEEAANAVTHMIGAGLAIAALVIMVVSASDVGSGTAVTAVTIFGSSLILVYLSSSLVHSINHPRVHGWFDMMDHCSIYLLIAGTNTPFALLALPPELGWPLFGVIWAMAVAGIAFKVIAFAGPDPKRFDLLSTILYVAMGWFGFLYSAWLLVDVLHPGGFMFLLLGGVFYTVGTPFYLWRLVPFSHAIWHLFTLAGSIMHFFSVLDYVIPVSS
ncbi:MAG: hemolysin III family protein [Alphaproteobacteria bacterium]